MKKSYTFHLFITALLTLLFTQAVVTQAFSQNNRSTGKRAVISNYSSPVINPPDDSEHQQNTYIETINPDQSGIVKTNAGSLNSDAPLAPAVVYTVGSGGTYASLGDAFAALGGGISTPVDLQMISNTTEVFPLTLHAIPGASATNYIRIYPTVAGISITANYSTGILDLNAIDYLTIDGRVNATGTTADMTIQNSDLSGSTYTVRFINGATNNTINYCKIIGLNTAANSGVVFFSTGTPGNSNNTISNCEITSYVNGWGVVPRNLIYSAGTAGQNNNNNTISSCLLYDYFRSGTGQSSAIYLNSNSSTWTITGNSIYSSTDRKATAQNCFIYDICINSGDGYTITNNYIGGRAPNCGGLPYTFSCGTNWINRFYHIYFTANVSTTNASSIQGNTIKNIYFYFVGPNNNVQYAAMYFEGGTVNVGTITGNTIGSGTGQDSITLVVHNNHSSITNHYLHAIRYQGSSATIQNNTIGSFTLSHTQLLKGDVANLYLIQVTPTNPTSDITISNNTIGSTTTASSIYTAGSNWRMIMQIKGITVTPSGSYDITVSNNTIANISMYNTNCYGPLSLLVGIDGQGSSRKITISGNTVYNLTSASANIETGSLAAVSGIALKNLSTTQQSITQNTIYGIVSTNYYSSTANGIVCESPATIDRNLVYGINDEGFASGIPHFTNGIQCMPHNNTCTVANNIVRLGKYASGGNSTSGSSIAGIRLLSGQPDGTYTNTFFVYHNSVFINGENAINCPNYTGCLFADATATRTVYNNSFFNTRTSAVNEYVGTKDQHFAIVTSTRGTLTCDYNNYYRPGGDYYATFADANPTNYIKYFDMDEWQDAKPHDDHSVYNEPGFIDETSVIPNLHMRATAGTCSNKGTPIASVTTDFDGDARSATTPDIGADEYSDPTVIVWNGSNSTAWDNLSNWNYPAIPKWADVVTIPSGQSRYPVITSSYSASSYDITIESGASITINPNASLNLRGSVTNNNGVDGIYIKSDRFGTGSLIQRDNLVQGYIERNVSGSPHSYLRKYHTVSIPLDESNDSYSGLFLNSYLFYFLEPDNYWIGMGAPTNTPISELRGYLICYIFGYDTTYSFQGPLKSGTFYPNVSGTFSGDPDNNHGWNLIPNPYASAINWTSRGGWSKTGIDNAVYVWNSYGGYASYVAGVSTNFGSKYIPVGQSFFVHANSTTPSIRMRNSCRVHNNTQPFLKNDEESSLRDVLKLKIENSEGATDELAVRFNEFATEQFDTEWDAYDMSSEEMVPNISTTSDMLKFSINALPYQSGEKVIPVILEYTRAGDLTFTASGMENFNMLPPIYLEDKLLEKFIDLHTEPEYQFTYEPGQTNRFNLVFADVTGNSNNTPNNWLIYRSNDKVYLDIPDLKGKSAEVFIYDIAGRKLLQEHVFFSGIKHVQAPVISGVYIVKIAGEKTYTRKIVVD